MTLASSRWLVSRPIAHRGLHDHAVSIVENSLSAATAAIEAGYAIECDVRGSSDGEAMVVHDADLGRLTGQEMAVGKTTAARLAELRLLGCNEGVPTFAQLLETIAGRTPLVCEIKSDFNGDTRLAERVAALARDYAGPLCLESFDPFVVAHLRAGAERLGIGRLPLGMVAQANYDAPGDDWSHLAGSRRRALEQFLHWPETLPDFLSWNVADLPNATPVLCRTALHLPTTAWTVRTLAQVAAQARWTDQMVFEGFRP